MTRSMDVLLSTSAGAEDELAGVRHAFFGEWAAWFHDFYLDKFDLVEEEIPGRLQYQKSAASKGDPAEIFTRVWVGRPGTTSPIRRLRLTLVSQGSQLQALNVVVYPSYDYGLLPVFGADLLSFNKHQRLLFGVDWAPMLPEASYMDQYIAPHMAEVRHGAFSELASSPGTRFYGEAPEFFSPLLFFARPEGSEAMRPDEPLWHVYCEYAKRYASMLKAAHANAGSRRSSESLAAERQACYDQWHAARDPALPIFARLFGADWSEEFVARVLFPGVASASQAGGC